MRPLPGRGHATPHPPGLSEPFLPRQEAGRAWPAAELWGRDGWHGVLLQAERCLLLQQLHAKQRILSLWSCS
eukprot:763496-Hanusia_phi.AAC.2